MSSSPRTGASDLGALASEFFVFVLTLQSEGATQAGDPRRKATELLRNFADRARAEGQPQDIADHCRFVMAALVDEVVMKGRLPLRETWSERPLAYELFDDLNAGETAFDRLERLRSASRNDAAAAGALEVYATALSLGFRGCKTEPGDEERLRDLVAKLCDQVRDSRGQADQLSPRWRPERTAAAQIRRLPQWWFAATAVTVVALTTMVLELLLESGWRTTIDTLTPK